MDRGRLAEENRRIGCTRRASSRRRVVVYTWEDIPPRRCDDAIAERGVGRKGDAIEIVELAQDFLDQVATTVERTNHWDISVTGGVIYLTIRDQLYTCYPRLESSVRSTS